MPPSAHTAGMEAADRHISAEGGELDDVKRELWDTWGQSPERGAKRAKETLGSKPKPKPKPKPNPNPNPKPKGRWAVSTATSQTNPTLTQTLTPTPTPTLTLTLTR